MKWLEREPSEEIKQLVHQLDEVHEQIKSNKYRLDHQVYEKYGTGYYDMLSEINDIFNKIRKNYAAKDANGQFAKIGWDFYHDFQADINVSRADIYWITKGNPLDEDNPFQLIYEREDNIERAIGYIHAFITTGTFNTFCMWYRSAYVQMDWNEDNHIYFPTRILKYYNEGRNNLSLEELQKDFQPEEEPLTK